MSQYPSSIPTKIMHTKASNAAKHGRSPLSILQQLLGLDGSKLEDSSRERNSEGESKGHSLHG